jgi:hypothetical protein
MPNDDDVLSLEGAFGLLRSGDADPFPVDGGEAPPAGANGDIPVQPGDTSDDVIVDNDDIPEDDEDEDDLSLEGNTDAPPDAGKTNDKSKDQGDDALPPIEAPSSWKTEEKEVWSALPRKAQEAIARREQAATQEVRNLQNKSAEQQKTVDAEVGKLKGLTTKIDSYLNEKVIELQKEFPEVKSEADLVALASSDPARAQLFSAKLNALQAVNNAKAEAEQRVAAQAAETQKQELAKAKDALLEAFPAWKDPEVARKEVTELQDYAIKTYGVPEATARGTLDPVTYKLVQKAMLYDRAVAARQTAVTRIPPRVVNKPGSQSADPRVSAREDARRTQFAKLEETGSIEDAIGLLRK